MQTSKLEKKEAIKNSTGNHTKFGLPDYIGWCWVGQRRKPIQRTNPTKH
jgi:hypothetical protein